MNRHSNLLNLGMRQNPIWFDKMWVFGLVAFAIIVLAFATRVFYVHNVSYPKAICSQVTFVKAIDELNMIVQVSGDTRMFIVRPPQNIPLAMGSLVSFTAINVAGGEQNLTQTNNDFAFVQSCP